MVHGQRTDVRHWSFISPRGNERQDYCSGNLKDRNGSCTYMCHAGRRDRVCRIPIENRKILGQPRFLGCASNFGDICMVNILSTRDSPNLLLYDFWLVEQVPELRNHFFYNLWRHQDILNTPRTYPIPFKTSLQKAQTVETPIFGNYGKRE